MLTRAFYTIPRTGLSLRISFVPDTPVRFSVFLDGYVRIIITGGIKVYQLGIAIIFIFGCCPAEIFARIIFFAGKVYAYFIIRWIPGTGVRAERNVRVGCLDFFTGKRLCILQTSYVTMKKNQRLFHRNVPGRASDRPGRDIWSRLLSEHSGYGYDILRSKD